MEITESTHVYHTNYVRNSRAIGVLWGVFTVCFAIINIVVFVQPQWIGDTEDSPGTGYFGLYEYCELYQGGQDLVCAGDWTDFDTILSAAFRASTFFIGFSCLVILICIACMLLFFFLNAAIVFNICGWFQVICFLCMFLGCVIYPAGWDHDRIRSVCGSGSNEYDRDKCGVRWAYILACIGIFDVLVLAILAFVLANRQAKLIPEAYAAQTAVANNGFIYDDAGKANKFIIDDDRKSDIRF